MDKHVLVFGAHTFLGFSLCEKLVNEGIEVEAELLEVKNDLHKNLLEERLLMVGRNALFHMRSKEERDYFEYVDLIIYCCDDSKDAELLAQDREQIKYAVEMSKAFQVPLVFISTYSSSVEKQKHRIHCEDYFLAKLDKVTILKLPCVYGPFQSIVTNDSKYELEERDFIIFIKDAVEAIYKLLENFFHGKTYYILCESDKQKGKERHYNRNGEARDVDIVLIENPISLKEGLKKLADFNEKYKYLKKEKD